MNIYLLFYISEEHGVFLLELLHSLNDVIRNTNEKCTFCVYFIHPLIKMIYNDSRGISLHDRSPLSILDILSFRTVRTIIVLWDLRIN